MPDDLAPALTDHLATASPPGRGEIRVFRVDLSAGPEGDDFRRLAEWADLDAEERARAERLVRPRDGRRFVRCRGALRSLLGGLLGATAAEVAFRVGPGGKPILVQPGGSRWRFNVTHSDELALIAVAWDRELGVDVERVRPIQQAARIVESYFTAAEVAEFRKLAEADQAEAFIRGWTRKEAVVKAQGVGLAGLATEFETLFGLAPPGESFRPCLPMPEVLGWRLWEATPRPGHVATLAVGPHGGGG
ncbi:4'-phosphopantetheinyl transferase superfamily protein [Paludisphaera sp.]|uniref:4'-phosphopantetheinyl transferase family protein n=1 Tax=Paludisphaera sp. TaxID=2017432 RepID=UPI00301DB932